MSSITYYNTDTITDDTQSYWVNILNNTPDTSRKMELQGTYVNFFEINCIDKKIFSFDNPTHGLRKSKRSRYKPYWN